MTFLISESIVRQESMKDRKPNQWEVVSSETVLDTPWYKVKKQDVQLPNGERIPDYYISEMPNVVLTVPVNKEEKMIFVQQYRHPVEQTLLEFPAGIYHEGEAPEQAARRELLEETGYTAETFEHLGTVVDYPTKDSHHIDIFLARNATKVAEPHYDRTEDITLVTLGIDEVRKYVTEGKIIVSGTIAAFTLATERIASTYRLDHPKPTV